MEIQEMIDVLEAYKSGKVIQFKDYMGLWQTVRPPQFNFGSNEYRIKPEPREWYMRKWEDNVDEVTLHVTRTSAVTAFPRSNNTHGKSFEVIKVIEVIE